MSSYPSPIVTCHFGSLSFPVTLREPLLSYESMLLVAFYTHFLFNYCRFLPPCIMLPSQCSPYSDFQSPFRSSTSVKDVARGLRRCACLCGGVPGSGIDGRMLGLGGRMLCLGRISAGGCRRGRGVGRRRAGGCGRGRSLCCTMARYLDESTQKVMIQ